MSFVVIVIVNKLFYFKEIVKGSWI